MNRLTITRGARGWAGLAVFSTVVLALSACDSAADSSGDVSGADTGAASVSAGLDPAKLVEGYTGTDAGLPDHYPDVTKQDGVSCTVGWSSPTEAQESLKTIGEAMAAEGERLGCEVKVVDANLSVDKQVSDIKQLVAEHVDAIVFYPLDGQALVPVLKEAEAAGIKSIGLEVNEGNPAGSTEGIVSQIQQAIDKTAYVQMNAVAQIKAGSKVGIIGIGVPVPALKYAAARQEFWGKELGLDVVGTQDNATDDPTGGEKAASALIAQNPDLDGIVSYNDASAFGAYSAGRSAGLTDLTLVGSNGATVAQVGQQAMIGAYGALTGVPLPETIALAGQAYTAFNIDSYTTWAQDVAAIASQ
jgi:ribose transport system substrate-binding protein